MGDALIPRDALDRIIRRAAELQAHERDLGEGLTKDELLALGKDVGIPAHYLTQAMLEEQTRSLADQPTGWAVWLAGPGQLAAERVVAGDRSVVERAVAYALEHEESLRVRRRFPDHTTWEPRRGALASIQRALSRGGRRYWLIHTAEVSSQVTQLEPGFCHVRLVADARNVRLGYTGGAIAITATTLAGAVVIAALTPVAPLALVPAIAGPIGAFAVGRSYRLTSEAIETTLAQVLDRLEHGEIKPDHQLTGPRASAFARIADEIKKTFDSL